MVHHSLVPCYTNKIIGLRRIEAYHSSRLNLTIPPSDEIPACAYSSETSSDSNTYNQKTRNVPRPCSSKRKRPPFSSSSSEDEDHLDSPKPLWTRRGILQPPTLIVRKQKQVFETSKGSSKDRNSSTNKQHAKGFVSNYSMNFPMNSPLQEKRCHAYPLSELRPKKQKVDQVKTSCRKRKFSISFTREFNNACQFNKKSQGPRRKC